MTKDRDHWQSMPFSRFARLSKGMSYKSEDYCDKDDGHPFVTLKCIAKGGGFSPRGIKFVRFPIPAKFRLKHDDLVIANTDLTRDGDVVGCPAQVPKLSATVDIGMSMDLSRVDFTNSEVDERFVFFSLTTPRVRKFMQDNSSGSTVLHLKTSNVGALELWMPTERREQSKIAGILLAVDLEIELTDALIKKHHRIRSGLMQDLLTRGIDEKGDIRSEKTHKFKDSPLGRIPQEWELRALSTVAEIDRGKFAHRPRNDPGFYDGKHPFVQTGDITGARGRTLFTFSQTLNERGAAVSREFPTNTVAITIAANIADTAILGCPMYFPDSVVGAVVKSPHSVRYIELCVRRAKRLLEARAPQSAQKNINLEDLRPLLIPVPSSPNEEFRIGECYEAHDRRIQIEEVYKDKLRALKRGLMDDLLTGKVRVNHLFNQ
jgi:type I restriction enzyme S subunit